MVVMANASKKNNRLRKAKSKNNQVESILLRAPSIVRLHPKISLAFLFLVAFLTLLLVNIIPDTTRVERATTIVLSVKPDMESFGASEQSSQRYCSTYDSPGFGADTRNCFSKLDAYFNDSNRQKMETVLSSEIQLLKERGHNIAASTDMVYKYGFRYSEYDSCTLDADFQDPTTHRSYRLDDPIDSSLRGHLQMRCVNERISFASRLFNIY